MCSSKIQEVRFVNKWSEVVGIIDCLEFGHRLLEAVVVRIGELAGLSSTREDPQIALAVSGRSRIVEDRANNASKGIAWLSLNGKSVSSLLTVRKVCVESVLDRC
jgi:hypothetical protein